MEETIHYFVMFLITICREPLFYIPAGVFTTLAFLSWSKAALSGAPAPGGAVLGLFTPALLALANLLIAAGVIGYEQPIGTWAIGVVATLFLAQLPLAAWLSWRMKDYWLGTLCLCIAQFWLACLTMIIAVVAIASTWQ